MIDKSKRYVVLMYYSNYDGLTPENAYKKYFSCTYNKAHWGFVGYYSKNKISGVHLNKATWLKIQDAEEISRYLNKLSYLTIILNLQDELDYLSIVDRFNNRRFFESI
jgi:hypothetical protein